MNKGLRHPALERTRSFLLGQDSSQSCKVVSWGPRNSTAAAAAAASTERPTLPKVGPLGMRSALTTMVEVCLQPKQTKRVLRGGWRQGDGGPTGRAALFSFGAAAVEDAEPDWGPETRPQGRLGILCQQPPRSARLRASLDCSATATTATSRTNESMHYHARKGRNQQEELTNRLALSLTFSARGGLGVRTWHPR